MFGVWSYELLAEGFVVVEVVLAQTASPGRLCWIWNHKLVNLTVCVCVGVCVRACVCVSLYLVLNVAFGSCSLIHSVAMALLSHRLPVFVANSGSCHITLSLSPLSYTHTHTEREREIHSQTPRPNSWWHNTAVRQNNSTLQLNMKEPRRSGPSLFRSQTGSMWSAVTLHTAATCSSKLLLTLSI